MRTRKQKMICFLFILCMALSLLSIHASAVNLERFEKNAFPGTFLFADVPVTAWYFPAVFFVQQNNIMQGTSDATFAPYMNFSRAMAVATLFRIYHERPANADDSRNHPFVDTPADEWFAPYVAWAHSHGIVEGIGSDRFAPLDYVDRQQFATMIHRYATTMTEKDTSVREGCRWTQFTDREQIQPWALDALVWSNYHGIITGRTDTTIAPDGFTMRSEAATILARFGAEDGNIPSPAWQPTNLVAHAGGQIRGDNGHNTLEALQNSAALGYQLIELDFLPTTDGEIVLNHNWSAMSSRVPGARNKPVSHEVFMAYRIFGHYTTMDLRMLISFLGEHQGIRIITDTKDEDYAALYAIATFFPTYIDRFIPQVYQFDDIPHIRALGFQDIIVTLYRIEPWQIKYTPAEITRLVRLWQDYIFAITIGDTIMTPERMAQLPLSEFRFFVHTINSVAHAEDLFYAGVYGVYTNLLLYESGILVSSR